MIDGCFPINSDFDIFPKISDCLISNDSCFICPDNPNHELFDSFLFLPADKFSKQSIFIKKLTHKSKKKPKNMEPTNTLFFQKIKKDYGVTCKKSKEITEKWKKKKKLFQNYIDFHPNLKDAKIDLILLIINQYTSKDITNNPREKWMGSKSDDIYVVFADELNKPFFLITNF